MHDPLTLPGRAESIPEARRFVRGAVEALAGTGAADDAETLVSELATNAVLHARTEFTIDVQRHGRDTVRVRVYDRSIVLPRQRSYGVDSTTGRGIRLIATLASAWGVEPDGAAGKAIWFDLPADGGSSLGHRSMDDLDVEALMSAFDDGDDGSTGAGPTAMADA